MSDDKMKSVGKELSQDLNKALFQGYPSEPIEGHTPGPWTATNLHLGDGRVMDASGRLVARAAVRFPLQEMEYICNLIASAPDLAAENHNLAREVDWWRDVVTSKDSEITTLEAENKRLREALEKIACRHVTENPLWWQEEARKALEGGE